MEIDITPQKEKQLPTLTGDEQIEFDALCGVVDRGIDAFFEVGRALGEIRNKRLYRGTHKAFERFCRDKWDLSGRHVNRQIAAFQITQNLNGTHGSQNEDVANWHQNKNESHGSQNEKVAHGRLNDDVPSWGQNEDVANWRQILPTNERQVRPLLNDKFDLDTQRMLWQKAVDKALEDNNGRVTGSIVSKVVQEHLKAETNETINKALDKLGNNPNPDNQPFRMSDPFSNAFDLFLNQVAEAVNTNFKTTSRAAVLAALDSVRDLIEPVQGEQQN